MSDKSSDRSGPKTSSLQFERFCELAPLNWEALPMLRNRLLQYGVEVERESITLARFPDSTTYATWEPAIVDVRKKGEPKRYTIQLIGTGGDGVSIVTIERRRYVNSSEYYLCVEFSSIQDLAIADDIVAFLGLRPAIPPKSAKLPRTAFVAHRFDSEGEQVADRLARFLALLDFEVKTGRGFSPQSVSEKVRKRIESQAVVFVVLTPGDDPSWLTQESVFSYAKDKPVFILRDMRVEFKPALFGDLEYIAFVSPAIEGAFVAVLEGLRELGYLRFAE